MSDDDINAMCNEDNDTIHCDFCGGPFDPMVCSDGIVVDNPTFNPDPGYSGMAQLKLCHGCAIQVMMKFREELHDAGICEHGEREGDWCEECNRDYKMARIDPENE